MHHNAAIIGLGNMGRRMLLYMTRHHYCPVNRRIDSIGYANTIPCGLYSVSVST